eukprot:g40020.t1
MGRGRRAVLCIDTGEVFPSIAAAARSVNRSGAAISVSIVADGTCAGYKWKFLEGDEVHAATPQPPELS